MEFYIVAFIFFVAAALLFFAINYLIGEVLFEPQRRVYRKANKAAFDHASKAIKRVEEYSLAHEIDRKGMIISNKHHSCAFGYSGKAMNYLDFELRKFDSEETKARIDWHYDMLNKRIASEGLKMDFIKRKEFEWLNVFGVFIFREQACYE
jgi:hypothetical protein